MTSRTRRALALPAGAVALATATLATQAFTPAAAMSVTTHQQAAAAQGWRVDKRISVRDAQVFLFSIDAVSARDTWTAGSVVSNAGMTVRPLIEHWDGATWRHIELPAKLARHFHGPDITDFIGASSTSNVWVFSVGGGYFWRAGGHWTFGRLPASKTGRTFVESAKVFSPTDVWVFGAKAHGAVSDLKFTPFAARFNGHRWTVVSVPGKGPMGPVSAISPRNLWAIVGGEELLINGPPASGSIVRWNGVAWQKVARQPKLPRRTILGGILARTSSDVWVGGGTQNSKHGLSEMAWHWNGTAWTSKCPRSAATGQQFFLSSLVPASGGMWALGENLTGPARVWRYSGAWSAPVRLPWSLFQLAGVPHTNSIWAIGENVPVNGGLIVLHGPVPR